MNRKAISISIGVMITAGIFVGRAGSTPQQTKGPIITKNKSDSRWLRFTDVEGTWRAGEFAVTVAGKAQPKLYVYKIKDANDLVDLTTFICWRYAHRDKDAEVVVKSSVADGHFGSIECEENYDPQDERSWPPDFSK